MSHMFLHNDSSLFYASVCSCSNTMLECPGIRNKLHNGWPPRGFYTEATAGSVAIMAVGKNPGHLLLDEAVEYRGKSPTDVATIHLNFAREIFAGSKNVSTTARRSTIFHKNLVRYMSYFLDISPSDIFKHIVYTNLVKCSTIGERDLLNPKTMRECFTRHLLRELNHFRPSVLVAFGREVERFLYKTRDSGLHSLPVVYVKHPSYHYRKSEEEKF